MTRIEQYLHLPGDNDSEVWDHLKNYVIDEAKFSNNTTKDAVLSCIKYEEKKIVASVPEGLNVPNSPFPVPRNNLSSAIASKPTIVHALKRYNEFISIINFLVPKDITQKMKDGDDAVRVEEGIYKLSKLLNSHRLKFLDTI